MPQTKNTGPTLTQVTKIGRQMVLAVALTMVILIVGRTVLTAMIDFWRAMNPPPPPPPTVGFGALPPIVFPTKTQDEKPVSYKLETATGGFPDFGDRAKVFFMPQSAPNLLADERVKQIAAQVGFTTEPEVLDSRTYRWTKLQPLQSTLQIDTQTLTLKLDTDYLSRPELLANNKLPDNFEAVTRVKSVLRDTDLLPEDMATASGEVTYWKSLGGELQPAVSFSDADYLIVDLNRTPVDDVYRMFTPEGYRGIVHAVISGAFNDSSSIVYMESNYYPIDYSEIHTYPIRSPQSAWQILQSGEGYVAQKGSSDQAVVRQVYLGYFDNTKEQEYLQPIYVFEGDGGFMGYVPAIDPRYVQARQ